jgi:hypothetical protein
MALCESTSGLQSWKLIEDFFARHLRAEMGSVAWSLKAWAALALPEGTASRTVCLIACGMST